MNEGLGFIVAQPVSNKSAKMLNEMLDTQGYKNYQGHSSPFKVSSQDFELEENNFRYKICNHVKSFYYKDEAGKSHKKTNKLQNYVYLLAQKSKARFK